MSLESLREAMTKVDIPDPPATAGRSLPAEDEVVALARQPRRSTASPWFIRLKGTPADRRAKVLDALIHSAFKTLQMLEAAATRFKPGTAKEATINASIQSTRNALHGLFAIRADNKLRPRLAQQTRHLQELAQPTSQLPRVFLLDSAGDEALQVAAGVTRLTNGLSRTRMTVAELGIDLNERIFGLRACLAQWRAEEGSALSAGAQGDRQTAQRVIKALEGPLRKLEQFALHKTNADTTP